MQSSFIYSNHMMRLEKLLIIQNVSLALIFKLCALDHFYKKKRDRYENNKIRGIFLKVNRILSQFELK